MASDYNRLATLQTKQGDRAPALENHSYAVTMTRALSERRRPTSNTASRWRSRSGDAATPTPTSRARRGARPGPTISRCAERDYVEAWRSSSDLQQKGAIQGTDLTTLESARAELARIRAERSAATARRPPAVTPQKSPPSRRPVPCPRRLDPAFPSSGPRCLAP